MNEKLERTIEAYRKAWLTSYAASCAVDEQERRLEGLRAEYDRQMDVVRDRKKELDDLFLEGIVGS